LIWKRPGSPILTTLLAALIAALSACGASHETAGGPARGSSEPASVSPAATTSAPATPGDVQSADACALLTEQDATVALGVDPGPGKTSPQGMGQAQCSYPVGSDGTGVIITAVIHQQGKALFDQLNQKMLASGSATAIPDLGDSAVSISAPGARFTSVSFVKGVTFVDIILNKDIPNATLRETALSLALTVSTRI
jgi:hypothetical protein